MVSIDWYWVKWYKVVLISVANGTSKIGFNTQSLPTCLTLGTLTYLSSRSLQLLKVWDQKRIPDWSTLVGPRKSWLIICALNLKGNACILDGHIVGFHASCEDTKWTAKTWFIPLRGHLCDAAALYIIGRFQGIQQNGTANWLRWMNFIISFAVTWAQLEHAGCCCSVYITCM